MGGEKRDKLLKVRVTDDEERRVIVASSRCSQSRSKWIRDVLMREYERLFGKRQ